MATILDNVARNLKFLGINGVEPMSAETRPDRIFAWDLLGELAAHIQSHPEHWSEDRWDPLHGRSTRHSWRERARPSMQVCEHAISPSSPSADKLPSLKFYEIDFDESGPNSFEGIFIHGTEVLVNALTGGLTNQDDIAEKLTARLSEAPKEPPVA